MGEIITGFDPGPTISGYVKFDFGNMIILEANIEDNEILLNNIKSIAATSDIVAYEKVASMGMAVGAETFETVFWTGRFFEKAKTVPTCTQVRITRHEIKLHLCNNARAKDTNIRQALIDRFGKPGTKKHQGILYGIKTHLWAALAVAVGKV